MAAAAPAALIIGVNHYQAFDASLGMMIGTSDLFGPINDTKLYYRLARQIGIAPKNIRVLTSAPVNPADYAPDAIPSQFSDATNKSIQEGLQWIIKQLSRQGKPVGFVAFSGHGDYLVQAKELVLCPQDVKAVYAPDKDRPNWVLEPVIRMADLKGPQNINLTYFLDVCHAASEFSTSAVDFTPHAQDAWRRFLVDHPDCEGLIPLVPDPPTAADDTARHTQDTAQHTAQHTRDTAQQALKELARRPEPGAMNRISGAPRCLTRRTMPGSLRGAWSNRPDAALVASDVGLPAFEFPFNGEWHGVFSWALVQVLNRWAFEAANEPGRTVFRISNQEVIERVKQMLQALEFRQFPAFFGRPALQNCRVLGREDDTNVGTDAPQEARKHEIFPDDIAHAFRVYTLTRKVAGVWNTIGQVLATGSKNATITRGGVSETFLANRTYWWHSTDPLAEDIFALKETDGLAAANHYNNANRIYENHAMSSGNTVNANVALTRDIFISDNKVGGLTQIANGAKTDLKYYMISGSGQQPPYFMFGPTVRLEFHSNPGVRAINGWQQLDNEY